MPSKLFWQSENKQMRVDAIVNFSSRQYIALPFRGLRSILLSFFSLTHIKQPQKKNTTWLISVLQKMNVVRGKKYDEMGVRIDCFGKRNIRCWCQNTRRFVE